MTRPKSLVRRVELQQLVRTPAPPEYDIKPHNRQQRRHLARLLRREALKSRGPDVDR